MKRKISILLLLVMIFSMVPFRAKAEQSHEDIVFLEDGSYIVTSILEVQSRVTGSKGGSKTSTYYANDGTLQWQATLTASFSYNGTSATCTTSNCSVTVHNSEWYTVSKNASKSGNTAMTTVTMGRKVLGITVDKDTIDIALSCDKNGNLS